MVKEKREFTLKMYDQFSLEIPSKLSLECIGLV